MARAKKVAPTLPIEPVVEHEGDKTAVVETTKFLPGVSGNPAGRPKGSKNRSTLIKAALEERLSMNLDKEADAIMKMACLAAKEGKAWAIKLLLGDFMAHTRAAEHQDDSKGPKAIRIQIENLTLNAPGAPVPTVTVSVDGEFDEVEDDE